MDVITSPSNPRIKNAAALLEAKNRREQGLFLIEGQRLCSDAAKCGIFIIESFMTEDFLDRCPEEARVIGNVSASVCQISAEAAVKLSDTKTPQGVFCVCKPIDKILFMDKIKYHGKYVALENMQNPSNLGAAARTALALGLDGIICAGGCDIYNPKAQRAAMGALLRCPVIETPDLPSLLAECAANGMKTCAAVLADDAVPVTSMDFSGGAVCVIGNEGSGVTARTAEACGFRITIPMRGGAESLNAACAAAVIMWEMTR